MCGGRASQGGTAVIEVVGVDTPAASMLAAAGHEVVAVDDEYSRAADAGLRLVTGKTCVRLA